MMSRFDVRVGATWFFSCLIFCSFGQSLDAKPVQDKPRRVELKAIADKVIGLQVEQDAGPQAEKEDEKKVIPLKVVRNPDSLRFEKKVFAKHKKNSSPFHGLIVNLIERNAEELISVDASGYVSIWNKKSGLKVDSKKFATTLWCIERLSNNRGFLVAGDDEDKGVMYWLENDSLKVKKKIPLPFETLAMLRETDNKYWCGTDKRGLFLVDLEKGRIEKRIKYGLGTICRVDEHRVLSGYSSDFYLIDTRTVETIPVDKNTENADGNRKRRLRTRGEGFVLFRKLTSGWICRFAASPEENIGFMSTSGGELIAFSFKNKRPIWKYNGSGEDGITWFYFDKALSKILAIDSQTNLLEINSKTGKLIKKHPILGASYAGFTKPKDGRVWIGGLRRPLWMDLKTSKTGLALDQSSNKKLMKDWIPGGVRSFVFNNHGPNWINTSANQFGRIIDPVAGKVVFPKEFQNHVNAEIQWADDRFGLLKCKVGLLYFELSTGKILHRVPLGADVVSALPDRSGVFVSDGVYTVYRNSPVNKSKTDGSEKKKNAGFAKKGVKIPKSRLKSYTFKFGANEVVSLKIKNSKLKRRKAIEKILGMTDKYLIVDLESSEYPAILDGESHQILGYLPVNTYNFSLSSYDFCFKDEGFLYHDGTKLQGTLRSTAETSKVEVNQIENFVRNLGHQKYSVRAKAYANLQGLTLEQLKTCQKTSPKDPETVYRLDALVRKKETAPLFRAENRFRIPYGYDHGVSVKQVLLNSESSYWLVLAELKDKVELHLFSLVDSQPNLVDRISLPPNCCDIQLRKNVVTVLMTDGKNDANKNCSA